LYMISLIALVILFIACFNYIMLTISHSMERMKEMAVMKILGAQRKNIIRQFWSESFLLVLLAMFLGIVLAEQLLPLFNKIAGKNLNFTLYQDWSSYLFLFVVLMAIVFITSFYITTFLFVHTNPLSILRRETVISHRYGFSRLFILIQYLISVTLLVCTTVITKQLNHLRTLDVGFNRNNLVEIDVDFRKAKVDLLKTRLLENPLIEQVTTSDRTFISGSSSELFKNKKGEFIDTRILRIDKDYVKSLGLKIIDGDNVQDALPGDTILKVLVNETLVKAYRMDEPVGDFIFFDPINRYVQIVGVVKDFHYDSMKDPIMPLIMETFPYNSIWAMFVRINPENRTAALDHIRKSWEAVLPEFPYDYTFMDDLLNGQYVNEERWAKITGISALLAILLTALGLLGLTGLLVSKRTKEIGIRKVNGARVWQILVLINADFMRWVLAAIVMAIPVGWYIMTRWLRNFENRTDLSWWYFAFAGLAAILIAAATVSWRSWRYARKNPVETLKYE
jgi:putative ABC transport system permease protein